MIEQMTIEQLLEAYPEGTAEGFAGYCDELSAWQMIVDVAQKVLDDGCWVMADGQQRMADISPACVAINGSGFTLVSLPDRHDDAFDAPEIINSKASSPDSQHSASSSAAVWSLGATVFRMVMGCNIMNGRGGKAQKATSKLPVMRSEMPALSRLVQQCLDFDPNKRPAMKDVLATAKKNLERCRKEQEKGPRMKPETASSTSAVQTDSSLWPEEMIPT